MTPLAWCVEPLVWQSGRCKLCLYPVRTAALCGERSSLSDAIVDYNVVEVAAL